MKEVKTQSQKRIYSGRVFDLFEEQVELAGEIKYTHASVRHPGAVVIVPEVAIGEFLLLYQYRHSMRKQIFEFPAGTLGKGEDPLACAQRELEEETGYQAENWIDLGVLYPAPGFCDEVQRVFLARELFETESRPEEDEIIEIKKVPTHELERMIIDGLVCDGKTLGSFLRARLLDLI